MMYGTSSIPAIIETRNDVIIVASISNQRMMILMIPPEIDLLAKNTYDQRALAVSCIQNNVNAIVTPGVDSSSRQMRNTETAIKIYKTVQTGPNAQFGGVYRGLFNPLYQSGIALEVKILPKPAAAKQASIQIISLTIVSPSIRIPSV